MLSQKIEKPIAYHVKIVVASQNCQSDENMLNDN